MKVELELWHLLTLLIAFLGILGTAGKLFFSQFDKRMSERFKAQEAAADASYRALHESVNRMLSLEREMLMWRAELPNLYVRREDYIRNQTIIESKLDHIASKMEIIQLRGARND